MNETPTAPLKILGAIVVIIAVGAVAYVTLSGGGAQKRQALSRSVAAFNDNNLTGALAEVQPVLANDPRNVDALLLKATIIAQAGSLGFKEEMYGTQAIAVAQQVLAIDPNNAEAYRIIGYANEIMQKYDQAHAAYAQALVFNPKSAAVISQEAHAWDLQGNLAKAEAGYRMALTIDPELDQARMGLGRIAVQKGDADEALVLFLDLAARAQNARHRAEGAYSAGVLAGAKGDSVATENFMRAATVSDPEYALGWAGLGAVLFSNALAMSTKHTLAERNELISQSFAALQRAIALNPNQSSAYFQLGSELAAVGQKTAAVKILDEASRIVPNDITLSAPEKVSMLQRIKAVQAVISKK